MQFFAKKYLISILLIVTISANVVAQEKLYSFAWLDRSEKMMAGTITADLVPFQNIGSYQLEFTVSWFDGDGNPVGDSNLMPFLWLSKWDFSQMPAQEIICTSFDQKKVLNLIFQSSGKLDLQVLHGYEGDIELTMRFRYALTWDLYEAGKSEPANFNGNKALKLTFKVQSLASAEGYDISKKNERPDPSENSTDALRVASESYQNLLRKVIDFGDHKLPGEIDRSEYLQDLEGLAKNIEYQMNALNPDSLSSDTFQIYRDRYDRLNDNILDLRTDYLRFKILQADLASRSVLQPASRISDSVRDIIRLRIEPSFSDQTDSLYLITEEQQSIALTVSELISVGKSRPPDKSKVDSLLSQHVKLRTALLELTNSHENVWNRYRQEIDTLMPVWEIENLHASFLKRYNELKTSIEFFDKGVAAILSERAESSWYASNRLIWAGLLIVLVMVFALTFWSASRTRKTLKEQFFALGPDYGGNQQEKHLLNGIFPNDIPHEYYTVSYGQILPVSVVGRIHYHTAAIKTVQFLVQRALLEKRGTDFGGYLFGNQYKLTGPGFSRSELFIEKACDSRYLRSSIANESDARADLVDELDELVRENKKYRLIGWFTSAAGSSMEIPEGLLKINQSFFKEKWHLGILLNPVSEVLQGAVFLRRKSGYLDPMPDPAAFIKWDELYRFALNPESALRNGQDAPGKAVGDYSRIVLDSKWGDSVVTAVNFNLPVVSEITAAAANQVIPKDTYHVVGFLYGQAIPVMNGEANAHEYEIFVDRFIESNNGYSPRELPGLSLVGWWGQANLDVVNYLHSAIGFHEKSFKDPFQISCLANPSTGELRIFTRKHSLEMNNSIIETEEYEIKTLLSR